MQVRARKVIKSQEKEFPKKFASATHKQGCTAKASNPLGTSDTIVLALEANLKKQLRVVNKFIRQRLGGKTMYKEEETRSEMKEAKGRIKFAELDEKACGSTATYRCKNVDEVLSKFLIDDDVFND